MPLIFYSFFLITVPAAASSILFFRIKKNHILATRFFFWHYALGFLIFTLVHIPIFVINLRTITISYHILVFLSSISFLALLFSYLLFYRGTLLLLTKERFITTIFPVFALPLVASLATISLFILKIGTLITYTAIVWGFLLPNNTYLGSLFLYFFIKGASFDTMKRRPSTLILSLGWFLVLASDIQLWINAATYHPELWILKIASMKEQLLLRTFAYLLILIGSLLFSKHLPQLKTPERE